MQYAVRQQPRNTTIMSEIEINFLLPLPGWPRARLGCEFTYENARLEVEGATVLRAATRKELERGVSAVLLPSAAMILLRLDVSEGGAPLWRLSVDGKPARREDELRARPTRSAWIHATIALAASAAGFVASYLYLLRATADATGWSLKMANHMAGWHLLLTFTLFPASVWGRRVGIRSVQFVSLVFFLIHVGIALANLGSAEGEGHQGGGIALFNALSGVFFLMSTFYGNRAWRNMDPVEALRQGRAYGSADTSTGRGTVS